MQALLHSVPPTLQQAIADPYLFKKHSQFCLKVCGVSGSWCAQGMFEPSECLWRVWGLILNVVLPLLLSGYSFSFALGHEISPQSCSSIPSTRKDFSSSLCVCVCVSVLIRFIDSMLMEKNIPKPKR